MSGESIAYQPSDSAVHRLHPLTKVLLTGCIILGVYLAPFQGKIALLGGVLIAAGGAGVGQSVIRTGLPILVPLGVGLLVIHGLFTVGDGEVLLQIGPITFWREGVRQALRRLVALTVFVLAGLLFITTTHPKKLMIGLTELGVPRKFGYVFVASLQLVPEFRRRARRILDAQRSRGLDTSGSIRNRLRALVALLSPLLIGALILTQTRSLALEARGFSRDGPRTSLYTLNESFGDQTLRLAGVAGVIVLAGWRYL